MAYINDNSVTGETLVTDLPNVPQTTQVHYHVEENANWTKASVIIAGVGVLLSIISLLRGFKK
jgi:hypothetical protein